ncbi:MAG: hypothetical protein E7Z63_01000 [Thermoplasmata archaeon]|nr:hypothetical protein [Thermoplasmata archaeon]
MQPTDIDTQDIEEARSIIDQVLPYIEWAKEHWLTLVLSGEIIGSIIAIKTGHYRKGVAWVVAALATIWVGAF